MLRVVLACSPIFPTPAHWDTRLSSLWVKDWSLFIADPIIKKSKKVLTNLKYQLKNNYPKTLWKEGYHSVVTHVLYYFCHMSLITAWMCNFLQSKSHVVCACTFFLSLPDKSKNDQDSDFDWFTIYCIDIWLLTWLLVFNIWVSHPLEMTTHFY